MEYNVLDEMNDRGLVYQTTDSEGLREHLKMPRAIYCGFDPTAPSLTVGNLVPILMLFRFQQAGHTPVVVLGGATGLIGDPSGKSAERPRYSIRPSSTRTRDGSARSLSGCWNSAMASRTGRSFSTTWTGYLKCR